MEKDVREHTEEKAGCQGAGEGTEDWKEKEKQQYLGGLRRLSEKGIAIYVDGRRNGKSCLKYATIICFIWEIMYRQNPEG